ncbi:helix-turn-helix domain-containing protein [Pseudocolwellia sp. HL-MZ19]|uniref:AlbA family DNA-binding domain-containing protein n=1 Tax=Pseudocolwellia sp. HL-MZ19 TaxID=3400846 RepID=UPI003CE75FF1
MSAALEEQRVLLVQKMLSNHEALINKKNYPNYYYEYKILDKMKDLDNSNISIMFNECYKYPQLNNVLLPIKELFKQHKDRVFPSGLESWINDMSVLALGIYRGEKLAYDQFKFKIDQGVSDEFTVPYYQLCIKAFQKLSKACNSYPFGSQVILDLANNASYLTGVANMNNTTKLKIILELDVLELTSNAKEILKLSTMKEGKNIEYKSSVTYDIEKNEKNKNLKNECTKTIASFLNSTGGVLLVGVADDGDILGLKQDLSYCENNDDRFNLNFKEAIKNKIGSAFFNNIGWDLEQVDIDKKVLMVKVKAASSPCWHNETEFFIRNNASSDQLRCEHELAIFTKERFK